MNPWSLPVADAEDWVKLVVLVIFVIFSVVGALLNKVRDAQREAMRRGRAGPLKPAVPKANDPLADEIAEFLKRAAQRDRPAAPEQAAPGPPPVPAPSAEELRPLRPPQLAPSFRPLEVQVVSAAPKRESVAEHVRESFGQKTFGTVGSEGLGKEVAAADEKIQSRLRGVFDHPLSQLAAVSGEASQPPAPVEPTAPADRISAAPATTAANLAAFLANPATLRQAIVVGEILHRPEQRWQ